MKAQNDVTEANKELDNPKQHWEARVSEAQNKDQRGDWIYLRHKDSGDCRLEKPSDIIHVKKPELCAGFGHQIPVSAASRSWILVAKGEERQG